MQMMKMSRNLSWRDDWIDSAESQRVETEETEESLNRRSEQENQ